MKKGLKKFISWILVFILGIAVNLIVGLDLSKADAKPFEMKFVPIGGTIVSGYLNTTNLAFSVEAYFPDFDLINKTELLLDGASFSTEIRGTPSPDPAKTGEVNFGSGTMNNTDLQVLMGEGPHVLSILKTFEDTTTAIEGALPINCDYILPNGALTSSATASPETSIGWLKIGDKLAFNLALAGADTVANVSVVNSVYNGADLIWGSATPASTETNFVSEYTVAAGDPDSPITQLTGVILTDLAGNQSVPLGSVDVDRAIDANAPTVTIDTPENGKSYNSATLTLAYTASDPVAVELDGVAVVPTPASGDPIGPLADGAHNVAITSTDLAGNSTATQSDFVVDTVAPFISVITGPDGQKIEQGQKIVVEGTTEANADVLLEVFSDPQTATTTADTNGVWRIEFDSANLTVSSHEAYITVTDAAGNEFRQKIASFEVTAKPEAATTTTTGTKVAQATTQAVVSDVQAPISSCAGTTCQLPPKEEVAKAGNILSSESERSKGFNWSAWIMLLAILVLASALATAGYYGYGWVVALSTSKGTASAAKVMPQTPPVVKEETSDGTANDKSDQEKPRSQTTRW